MLLRIITILSLCSAVLADDEVPVKIRYEEINSSAELTRSVVLNDPFHRKFKKMNPGKNKLKSPENRINIVFVGDGYTKDELTQFKIDVDTQIENLTKQEPFKSYRNYFAFNRIDTASENSGVKLNSTDKKNTAFDMYYNCSGIDRLLCIDTDKVMNALTGYENFDIVLALANSDKYGGAGYLTPSIATLAARNATSTELALHEMGHSFADLSDEYEASGITTDCDHFQNSSSLDTSEMSAQKSKWYRWLDLPNVGAFRGSCYSQNFFRPTDLSKMRALNHPYDEINTEQIIKRIYEKVKPIDSWLKTDSTDGHFNLQLQILKQSETPLRVQWSVDGHPVEILNGL
ncbi:MAG: M64 family metallopeptidase, partial [Pseudobdellovibrio sp.]